MLARVVTGTALFRNRSAAIALATMTSCYRGTSSPAPPPQPLATAGITPSYGTIAAGSFHSCAIDQARRVWCWGHGIKGQVGPHGDHQAPVPSGIDDAIQVVGGEWFTCARRTGGAVECIGENDAGQLAAPANGVVELGAGSRFACARMRDTSVRCWGQVPSGTPPARGARQLAVGSTHACALMEDRSIECWGMQFGDHAGAPTDVVGIAAGGNATCAWTRTGEAWCWGDRAFNQLGADSSGVDHVGRGPARVPNVSDVRAMAVGFGRACAIDSQGAVTCWGTNYMGGLGVRTAGIELPPTPLTALDRRIVEIAIGARHTCARAADRSIWCWGANYWGELGAGPIGQRWKPERVRKADR